MPNHVSHKISFSSDHSEAVFSACCPGGRFDFDTLIQRPPHMYHGDTTAEDEKDFRCNWNSWQRENWGTKWNAYDCSCKVEGEKAVILFDTAWSIPYPVVAAFANKFAIPFEHRYFDEGHNFWGIEEWEQMSDGRMSRKNKQQNREEDKAPLCIELKGYDPNQEDDEDDNQ